MLFTQTEADERARSGVLSLRGCAIATPAFMPVATAGAIRALPLERVGGMGYALILSNVYHLYLRPGSDIITAAGGLHDFIGWERGILTDSGGFQVFSLKRLMNIGDDGIAFRSHVDGSAHYFTPEAVIDIQLALGSDIMMPLDHCTAADVGYREAQQAARRTTHWLMRSSAHLQRVGAERAVLPHLFGIVQGNFYPTLRARSAEQVTALDLPGYAIGGLSVGEERTRFADILAHTAPLLPCEKPRYLMGIGTPEYVLRAISEGIDMFDCVYPTRVARHGVALTAHGAIDLHRSRFRRDSRPLASHCLCDTCRKYTRAYIRHLVNNRESMAMILLSEHNLFFMHELVSSAAQAIQARRYRAFMTTWLERYAAGDA